MAGFQFCLAALCVLRGVALAAARPRLHDRMEPASALVTTPPAAKIHATTTHSDADALATKTSSWFFSTASTEYSPFGPQWTYYEYTTTGMVTRLEPVPTTIPTRLEVRRYSDLTMENLYGNRPGSVRTTYSGHYLDRETWHLLPPQATDLPPGVQLQDTCKDCLSPEYTPDPECEALGLQTACQAQCARREADGPWWCREINIAQFLNGPDVRMGRACWGNMTHYKQLNAPCVVGDPLLGCTACRGDLNDWSPARWH